MEATRYLLSLITEDYKTKRTEDIQYISKIFGKKEEFVFEDFNNDRHRKDKAKAKD